MVSTRSQSRLSASVITGLEPDGPHEGEVSSKAADASDKRGKAAQLAPIAEERPSRTRRKGKEPAQEEEEEEEGGEISERLLDKVADDIFAALESGFGTGGEGSSGESSGSESSDDEDEGGPSESMRERHLLWRPAIALPGPAGSASRSGGAKAAASADLLDDTHGGRAKLLHVPPPDKRAADRAGRKAAPDTAGKGWYDLPATEITDEVKADLRVLRLRSALDPKAFYKKFDSTKFPKYFQFGTVVEGAADFYSGRLTKKERKRTLADEIMADSRLTEVRKKRFGRMQEEAGKWGAKPKGRKTDNARLTKKPRRAKH